MIRIKNIWNTMNAVHWRLQKSDQEKDLLKVKLEQLQCHFTWGPQKGNIDLDDMKQRLEDSVQTNVKFQPRFYNQLAFVNCLQGNCEEAIQNLKEAEKFLRENHEDEFDKRIVITYGNYAWIYYHMGQLTEAQSYLDKLERICKQFPEASRYTAMIPEVYGEKGWSLLKSCSQYYEEAKECFKKAVEKVPDNIEWNVGYAIVLSRLEHISGTTESRGPTESMKQFRRVLEFDPNHGEAMVLLALKLQHSKQSEEAIELVEKALQKSPDLPHVLRYAAKFYRLKGDVEKAVELLKKGLEMTPHSTFLHHQIGVCYRNKLLFLNKNSCSKRPDEPAFQQRAELIELCKYHFKKAFEPRPLTFIRAQLHFARICSLNEEYQNVEEIYNNLLRLEDIRPENKQAICLDAGLFELHQKNSESNAITHFLEGMKVDSNSTEGKRCCENLKSISERQIRRNPKNSKAHGVLGLMHQLDGKKREAVESFEKALELDPDNEEYLSALCELRLSISVNNDFPNEH
ncbi:interferon-induced protein with tetratricopeptide repeats 5-like isoform X2 [Scyliorhinus canicula]|uniref:interferon-induced protein with tetratricopeptide repeats 5-like isoform X2 n=1 Tax=Scyliorhinus canicula TaxID=7830 RepID=UPI0018F2C070|nr:interferon-induced protein with tetratricopeptide repeats 5-like isoform X2 [Scyliorhinus canicula]